MKEINLIFGLALLYEIVIGFLTLFLISVS